MKRYILNSAVITTEGKYEYNRINVYDAVQWLKKDEFDSTIGYPETADALSQITKLPIPCVRKNIKMDSGDEALVFRLTGRVADWQGKGKMGLEYVLKNCEIGMLTKI